MFLHKPERRAIPVALVAFMLLRYMLARSIFNAAPETDMPSSRHSCTGELQAGTMQEVTNALSDWYERLDSRYMR